MSNKNKTRDGVVYSTNPQFEYNSNSEAVRQTLPAQQQTLRLRYETKHRGGKPVTIVSSFIGLEADLNELGRTLKVKCGTGGTVKEGEIIIQGDFRERIKSILTEMGYKVKG